MFFLADQCAAQLIKSKRENSSQNRGLCYLHDFFPPFIKIVIERIRLVNEGTKEALLLMFFPTLDRCEKDEQKQKRSFDSNLFHKSGMAEMREAFVLELKIRYHSIISNAFPEGEPQPDNANGKQ